MVLPIHDLISLHAMARAISSQIKKYGFSSEEHQHLLSFLSSFLSSLPSSQTRVPSDFIYAMEGIECRLRNYFTFTEEESANYDTIKDTNPVQNLALEPESHASGVIKKSKKRKNQPHKEGKTCK